MHETHTKRPVFSRAVMFLFSIVLVSPNARGEDPLPPEYQRIVQEAADAIRETRIVADSGATRKSPHFARAVELAHDWPRPELRDALLYLLETNDSELLYDALIALMPYDEPLVDAAVRRFVGDERKVGPDFAVVTIGQLAQNVLGPASQLDPFAPAEGLLPAESVGEIGDVSIMIKIDGEHWRMMSVPVAINAVRADDLSVRLQAWLWLAARHGIVLDPKPLEDSWSRMDLPRQKTIALALMLQYSINIGGERLRPFLTERLEEWDDLDPTMRTQLLVVAGRVGVRGAKERAKKIIRRAAGEERSTTQPSNWALRWELDERVENAFLAFACEAGRGDLEIALQWTKSRNPLVQEGAAYVLAGLEDWRAVYAVMGHIASSDGKSVSVANAVSGIEGEPPANEDMKWTYVCAVGRMLAEEMKSASPRQGGQVAMDYLGLLRQLTGWNLGSEGLRSSGIDLDALPDTAGKWERWIAENAPATRRRDR